MEKLSAASFKGRRRNRAYEDEEEDIDSLLSSVKKVEDDDSNDEDEGESGEEDVGEGGKRRVRRSAGRAGRNEESMGVARRKKVGRGEEIDDDDMREKDVEEGDDDGSEGEDGRVGSDGKETEKRRLPKGQTLTAQETVRLDNVSLKGRRRQVIKDEDEDLDSVLANFSSANEKEEESDKERKMEEEQGEKKRLPKGKRITAPDQSGLEAVSFKDRRRRKIEDEVSMCEEEVCMGEKVWFAN